VSPLLKAALVVYTVATAATGGLTAYALAVEAWPLALGLVATWMFGWNAIVVLGYAELERCREGAAGGAGAGETSTGRHRADPTADQAVDELAVV